MANEFLTLQTIARRALPRLMENLVMPNLTYKDFSNEFTNLGDTIRVRKPNTLEAKDFDPSAGVSYQDMKDSCITVKLDKIATVDAEASAIETAVNIDALDRVFVEPAAVALAEKINREGLKLYTSVPSFVGTAGTTPSTLDAFAQARKQLNVQKVPTTGRVALWDPEADAKFSVIPSIVNAEKSGSVQALREGAIGRVMGFDNYMAQDVCQHQTGITAATAVKVNGAVTKGATSLALDGTTLTGKLVKGDLLTIGAQQFTVTEDTAEASSNAIATVKVYPAVKADIADNASVTLTGNHTANLAFNPFAFAFVTRPLINPNGQGVESYVTSYNGVSLRVTKGYDQKYKKSVYSMDVLYSFAPLYPELATRVLG